MKRGTVVKASQVMPFSPKGYEGQFESKMLIDRTNSASEKLQVNQFVLKPGCGTEGCPSGALRRVARLERRSLPPRRRKIRHRKIRSSSFPGTFHFLDNKSQTKVSCF
jgi:hypothetical protein